MVTVAVLVGSLRAGSMNMKLALALEKTGADLMRFTFVPIGGLPLFSQDLESDPPPSVAALREAVAQADAVLFVTPEYNRSIPGVLKNALDWGSRPAGRGVWAGKPAAMTGASGGSVGTAVAQAHLRGVLGFLGMAVTVQPELYFTDKPGLIAEDGTVTDATTARYLRRFMESFVAWIARQSG